MLHTRGVLAPASPGEERSVLTYETYYGLNEKAFSLSADPKFLFKSPAHSAVYDDLRAGIHRREGLIVLTGDVGTGKTTLCRSVLNDLDRKTFSAFVADPFVSPDDLLRTLLLDFGVTSLHDLKKGSLNGLSRLELSYPLHEFLRSLAPLQAFAVLVIDEAQNLSQALLEEIRILSDLEGPEKLLQVVLVGQLELQTTLKDQHMRQVDQRVSVRCRLHALDRDALTGYIAHRLGVATGGSPRVSFASDAVDLVHRASHGNPRVINIICDKALHFGHLAPTFTIGRDIVRYALSELGIPHVSPSLDPMEAFRPEDSFTAVVSRPKTGQPTTADGVRRPQDEEASKPVVSLPKPSNTRRWVLCLAAAGLAAFVLTLLLLGWLPSYALSDHTRLRKPPAASP